MRSELFGIEALGREPARLADRRAGRTRGFAVRRQHVKLIERKFHEGRLDAQRQRSHDEPPRSD